MAFAAGVIACGYGGAEGSLSSMIPIFGRMVWCQKMAVGGTTAQTAPAAHPDKEGNPIFRVLFASDVYVAVGANPDATNGPCIPCKGGEIYDIRAQPGDRLAWVLA